MLASAAFAHAFLDRAIPPVGGIIATSPPEIRLTFSEGVEPRFSGIKLATAAGETITTPPATVDPARNTELVLRPPVLPPGRYKVSWHVVSVDTHRTEGDFTFTILP